MAMTAATAVDWLEASWRSAYHTPVAKAIEGLTAAQAFWRPGPERHSIWQNVMHMAYWREYFIRALEGNPAFPSGAELGEHNWPRHPETPGEEAWAQARRRLQATQERLVALLRSLPLERLEAPAGWSDETVLQAIVHYMGHDSYHVGQIMLLRALQGLAPVD